MAINLWDYETGAPFEGDYDAALADLQKRLSHLFVANEVHARKTVILCEGWTRRGRAGRSSA